MLVFKTERVGIVWKNMFREKLLFVFGFALLQSYCRVELRLVFVVIIVNVRVDVWVVEPVEVGFPNV